jgi:hypothetical protein
MTYTQLLVVSTLISTLVNLTYDEITTIEYRIRIW